MHKHGGHNAPPLAVDQHVAGVVGAKVHQLLGGWRYRTHTVRHHVEKDRAVDAYQQVCGRRDCPRRPWTADRRRRRRHITGTRRQKLRLVAGVPANGSLFAGWRRWGITSHDSTLKHFLRLCRMSRKSTMNLTKKRFGTKGTGFRVCARTSDFRNVLCLPIRFRTNRCIKPEFSRRP